jgi:hypothetical protein
MDDRGSTVAVNPHLRRAAAIRLAIGALTLTIPAAWATGRARTLARRIRYGHDLRIPGLPDDGEPLEEWERAAFLGIDRGWKHTTPERTRHP